ncbi:TerB family tellurite resistance protein [Gammaproteobacteria bacterium]|nr:TerB family tellurite resistance protein [Gammaproteobacteria bacterium]
MASFFNLFKSKKEEITPEAEFHSHQIAVGVLLIEMARADFHQDESENQSIVDLLKIHFKLTPEDSTLLFSLAEEKLDASVSLHEFTKDLHDTLSHKQKEDVIALLWKLAVSDNTLDKYEDYLVRKIADLLYVSNSIVLKIKHQVFTK